MDEVGSGSGPAAPTTSDPVFGYAGSPWPIRADLAAAHRKSWESLRNPGTWWNGSERVALAAQVRAARDCAICRERKQALSPGSVDAAHPDGLWPVAENALPITLNDVVTNFEELPERFGPADTVWGETICGSTYATSVRT